MNQFQRIIQIYRILEENPKTLLQIYNALIKKKVKISKRQIYLDIAALNDYYLRDNEILMIDTGRYNQKLYRLVKKTDEIDLSYRDISTFQLTRTLSPRIISEGRAESMKKFRNVYKSFVSKKQTLYSFMSEEQNIRSGFFEALYDETFNKTLDDIIWSIANAKILVISEIIGDATSIKNKSFYPVLFKPIKLIFHRGDYVVAGFDKNKNNFLIINVSKIIQYEISKTSFPKKNLIELTNTALSNRFGVTDNINNKIYTIKLEFSSHTGEFISHYLWHETQKFNSLENGNWVLEMNCGINRELIGWIYMWMSNVKILTPSILKQVFLDHMKSINDIYQIETNLKYKNIFTPLTYL